jgi:hypothetical protein
MADSIGDRLADVHPQMVRAGLRDEAKADRKNLVDLRTEIGRLVERALQLLGISKQDAAWRMNYTDAGAVSRWCAGSERPLFDKLFTIDGFKIAYVLALAEKDEQIEVETVLKIKRIA